MMKGFTAEELETMRQADEEIEREFRLTNKLAEYQKAYYKANREKLAAQQKAYREANREKAESPRY